MNDLNDFKAIKGHEIPKKPKKGTTKKISDTGKPRTWEWMGETQKFGIIMEKRNPMHIEYDEQGKAKIPAQDVDWWNSVWEFLDCNWDRPPYNIYKMPSQEEHPAVFNPFLVEQLIYRYSKEGEMIFDPMCGSGTTLIVARLMKRHSIGVDLSPEYVKTMKTRCQFQSLSPEDKYIPQIFQGDSMKLNEIPELSKDSSVDLIIFSPPYFDIKSYETHEDDNQIGDTHDFQEYLNFMEKILQQCYRVLKPGKFCCVVVSNVRKGKLIPVAWKLADIGEKVGFDLWDDIVHHTSHSMSKAVLRGGQWGNAIRLGHCVRTHESVIVLKKPEGLKNGKL